MSTTNVLITGAGSGIGRAVTERLAAKGRHVYAGAVDDAEAQSIAEIAGDVTPVVFDVTDSGAVETALAGIRAELGADGRLDAVFNIAGMTTNGPLADLTPETFSAVLAVNLVGTHAVTRAALPLMGRGGRVINMSSSSGTRTLPFTGAYSASKFTEAVFDEKTSRWTVRIEAGDAVTATYAVFALGNLSAPNLPDVPGIDRFEGEVLHTAQWPLGETDFTGRRVGVIGTGSSGVQVIPELAKTATDLTVFQRTPAFSLPARNKPLDDDTRGFLEQALSFQAALVDRGRIPAEAYDAPVPPRAEQWQKYEELWKTSGAMFIAGGYPNVMVNEEINAGVADFLRSKIREQVTDPVTAEDLCPDYPYGAKRACLDTGYYATYNQPNVHLVNLCRDPIVEVTADAVITGSGRHDLDVLVLATGFDAVTGALAKVDIRGIGGRSLAQAWADGPKTYLGVAVAGFPNVFLPTAPGGVSVIGNVLLNNEHNVEWIAEAIAHVRRTGAARIEADEDAQEKWMTTVAEMAEGTLYHRADSWYLGANIPGKPREFTFYIGPGYLTRCAEVAANGYPGFSLS